MKRTIEINPNNERYYQGYLFYRGKMVSYLMKNIAKHFRLYNGSKYCITIVLGTEYSFPRSFNTTGACEGYYLYKEHIKIGYICKREFDKLFFVPDENEEYDIVIKKVT